MDSLADTKAFLDRIPGGLFRYPAEGFDELDYVNKGLLELYKCDTLDEFKALTGYTFSGMVYPDDFARIDQEIYEQVRTGDKDHVVYRIQRADGEIRWVDDRGHLVEDESGKKWFYVTLIDITETVQARHELERANERLEILTALSNDIVFDIECGTGEAHVYGDFQDRFEREPRQEDFVVKRRCNRECNLTITTHDLSALMEKISDESLVDFEASTSNAAGEPIWYRYQSVVLYDEGKNAVRHVGRLLDTHTMAVRESQFRKKAEHDSLTGLYNRSAALDKITTLINTENRPYTFFCLDVDDFKVINDTYGHPEGDRVLKELSAFLMKVMRKEDVVARMGGDEFAIFATGLTPGPALDRILAHLQRGPFATQREEDVSKPGCDKRPTPTLSIGAVCCLDSSLTFDELYKRTDEVLYNAKRSGKARAQVCIIGDGSDA